MKKKLASLVNQTVKNLFLVVWAPFGEEGMVNVDISIGIVTYLNPSEVVVITTNKDDMWSVVLRSEALPLVTFPFPDFSTRMASWMNQDYHQAISYEYYAVIDNGPLSGFLDNKILNIYLLSIEHQKAPFAVRIDFENDYILSMSNSSGNTIETKKFNNHRLLEHFRKLGTITEQKIN